MGVGVVRSSVGLLPVRTSRYRCTTFATVALDLDLARQIERAVKRIERDTEERDRLILLAYAQGASLREIAEVAGITHVGVKKLVGRRAADFVLEDADGNLIAILEAKDLPADVSAYKVRRQVIVEGATE